MMIYVYRVLKVRMACYQDMACLWSTYMHCNGKEYVATWHDVRTIVCACGLLIGQVTHWQYCDLMAWCVAFWLGVYIA